VASKVDISADLRKSVQIREQYQKLHENALKAQANHAKFQNLKEALS
jgi:hypothetical protein